MTRVWARLSTRVAVAILVCHTCDESRIALMLYVETMTWPELQALDRARTVVFVPFSPLEEHGPHLPIGTDLIVARHLAKVIAQRIETQRPTITVLLAPSVPLGAGTIPMAGSVNISADLVFDVARQIGTAYARDGFRYIVFTSGHMGGTHLLALENAARAISRRYGVHAIAPAAAIAREVILRRSLAGALAGDMATADQREFLNANHSGMLETSLLLAIQPELVKPAYVRLPRLARTAMLRWRGRQSTTWAGYMGDPAKAAAAWGDIAIAHLAEAGAAMVLRIIDQGKRETARAHILPRVPFWLARRRLGVLVAATSIGAGIALAAAHILSLENDHTPHD